LVKRILCLVLVAWLVASCDMQKMMKEMAAPQDLALAHHAFDQLRSHDFAALETEYAPAARKADLETTLGRLAAIIPTDDPGASSITYVKTTNTNGHRTVMLILLYQFPTRWLQFDISTEGDSVDAMAIETLDVSRIPVPVMPAATSGPPVWLILAGLTLWLLLMIVIYRRYARKTR